jgi:Fe2+ or Zn2+ uptake regulation protein
MEVRGPVIDDVRHDDPAAFRMTPQREAVLAAVRSSDVHPSAEDILGVVRDTSPGIGVATVYRTLDLLVRHGRVQELRLGDESVTRYDGNVRRHDHVICSDCGQVFDVEVSLPDTLVAAAGGQVGVTIDDYDLQLRGRCERCRQG